MKFIKTLLITGYEKQDHDRSEPDGQSEEVNDAKTLIAPQSPDNSFQTIHKIVLIDIVRSLEATDTLICS